MARQKLGQHFLASGKVLDQIARAVCGEQADLVVEIGAGRGALTEHLLRRSDRVVAIEFDPELARYLRERWSGESKLEICEANALELDWSRWGPGVVTGNLPYYIATPLISRFLHAPGPLTQAVFLIQKEVAERITAQPGSREYGYLSVECQLLALTKYLFTVPPGAFRPPPEVDSAVIRLLPRTDPAIADPDAFLRFVSTCFRYKRKTLRNNLAGQYELSRASDILSRRAEQLSLADFIDLYDLVVSGASASTV
jgi:16S rRNA (adenine1518-N6/adenine1519-N6)-dimethyltransferase